MHLRDELHVETRGRRLILAGRKLRTACVHISQKAFDVDTEMPRAITADVLLAGNVQFARAAGVAVGEVVQSQGDLDQSWTTG